jgi:cell division protein FtsB
MSDLTSTQSVPQTDAEYEAIFVQQLAEMRALNERIRRDRAEIDRLKTETDSLKAEGARLEGETQAILTRLQAVV